MKTHLSFLITFFAFALTTFAQNSIQLNIHHKLGESDFAFNSGAKNNLDNDFNVNRLEYYISEVSIVHDGGMETMIDELWILADASVTTQVDLGEHAIEEVEGINFHIGVDPDVNHLDPATYPATHPLAPKFPSMHWGWSAGYRFIALEGNGSSTFNQVIELHGLGDDNYFKTEVALSVSAENNEIVINLDADYTRALEDIAVNSGVIVHGETNEAKKAVENFRDHVFTPSVVPTSRGGVVESSTFNVFPNPTTNGVAHLQVETKGNLLCEIQVTDMLGRVVNKFEIAGGNSSLELNVDQPGLYFITLSAENQRIATQKLLVN